jgi:hypothetical protein
MIRLLVVLLIALLLLLPASQAGAIRGMCAAAQFFGWSVELLNDLCWVELSLTSGVIPDEIDYLGGGPSGGGGW